MNSFFFKIGFYRSFYIIRRIQPIFELPEYAKAPSELRFSITKHYHFTFRLSYNLFLNGPTADSSGGLTCSFYYSRLAFQDFDLYFYYLDKPTGLMSVAQLSCGISELPFSLLPE